MADKAYEYMDWPRIEAIVYGEEASPRDVMQPRVTEDGVLIQGFFPGADAAEVVVGEKSYPMILEDEAGYYAVMLPLKRIPEYRFIPFFHGFPQVIQLRSGNLHLWQIR